MPQVNREPGFWNIWNIAAAAGAPRASILQGALQGLVVERENGLPQCLDEALEDGPIARTRSIRLPAPGRSSRAPSPHPPGRSRGDPLHGDNRRADVAISPGRVAYRTRRSLRVDSICPASS